MSQGGGTNRLISIWARSPTCQQGLADEGGGTMEDQEPLVIPATAVQEGLLRWISSNGPGRRAGEGIARAVSAFNRRRLGAVLDDEPWTPLRRPVASATVALVATGGVHLRTDPPFNPHGDGGFRALPPNRRPGGLPNHHHASHRP